MKKTVRAALIAAMVCFSSSLFAAEPVSFLKDTTFNLFEDETVDNFAWGLEEADGLVLGGFNSANYSFNFGVGRYIGPFWYSIFDTGYIDNDKTTSESVTNDAVSIDHVNIDYFDKSRTKTTEDHLLFSNDLFLSFATDNWGLQFNWFIERNDPDPNGLLNPNTDNYTTKTSETSTEIVTKESKTTKPENMSNLFAVEFNGIQTAEFLPVDMFFRLDKVAFGFKIKGTETVEKTSTKRNGSIYGFAAADNQTVKTKDYNNVYAGALKGTMGLTMSESEAIVSKFELGETFEFAVNPVVKTEKTTNVTEDATQEVSYSKTVTTSEKTKFLWTNTLEPKFIFEFTPEEKLSVNAAAGASIAFGRSAYSSPVTVKTVEKTVTDYKNTHTSTENYKKKVDGPATGPYVIEDEFTTTINPYAQLGLIYKIKPGKFHLNLGLRCDFSELEWVTTTTTNTTVKTTSYESDTNEAGYETVSTDSVTYLRNDGPGSGDGTAETKVTTFTAGGNVAAEFKIGTTWFMSSKVQMDIAYSSAFNTIAFTNFAGYEGLLDNELKIMFTVKF